MKSNLLIGVTLALFGQVIATEHDPAEIKAEIGKLLIQAYILFFGRTKRDHMLIRSPSLKSRVEKLVRIDTLF